MARKKKKEKILEVQNRLIDVCKVRRIIDRLDSNIIDERDGSVLDKNRIEHLMIIFDSKANQYMRGYKEIIEEEVDDTDYSALSEEEICAKVEEEIDWATEVSDLEDFDPESDVEINAKTEEFMLSTIKKEFRLPVQTMHKLKHRGWFIVPIIEGMTEFRPLWWVDVKDKCYSIVLKDEPLFTLPKTPFRHENNEVWRFNAKNIINHALKGTEYEYRFDATAPVHHVRNRKGMLELKQAMSKYEAIKKLRIKMGNQIISLYYRMSGQNVYDNIKAELNEAENKKSKKKKTLKDTKIIEYMVKEFKEFYKYIFDANLENMTKKWTKELRSFIKRGQYDEASCKDFIGDMVGNITKQAMKDPGILKSEKDFNAIIEVYDQLKFLESYIMYQQVNAYLVCLKEEDKAKAVLADEVRKHPIWQHYLVGIPGCAETIAAYILTTLNPELSIHASGYVRYMGLDQVIEKPDLSKNPITNTNRKDALALAIHQYYHITDLAEQRDDTIGKYNYYKFTEDSMKTYEDFLLVKSMIETYKFDRALITAGKLDKQIDEYFEDIIDNFSYLSLLNRICSNLIIRRKNVHIDGGEIDHISVPFVHKRARRKTDLVTTTHITKEGKLGLKKGCGYNTQLKSKLMVVFTDCIRKLKKNEDGTSRVPIQRLLLHIQDMELQKLMSQYGVTDVDMDTDDAVSEDDIKDDAQHPLSEVEEDGTKKKKISMSYVKMRANRRFIQIFVQDLWLASREIYDLPINGGLYMEEKYGRYHGFDRPVVLERAYRTKRDYNKDHGLDYEEAA